MHDFTKYLVQKKALGDERLTVVDVGVSGGLERKWFDLGPCLRGFGFDILENEVEALQGRIDSRLGVSFHAACIGTGAYGLNPGVPSNWVDYSRLSMNPDQDRMTPNMSLSEPVFTDTRVSLDAFFKDETGSLDFIKIDTDGADFDVIQSGRRILNDNRVLGLEVECQFHGECTPEAGVFANIDTYLREQGFSLFSMDPARTPRRALPGKAKTYYMSDSDRGQLIWANARYFRDLALDDYQEHWPFPVTPTTILKLACLYELHGLNDCAAELLVQYKQELDGVIDVEHGLNLLTQGYYGEKETYADHMDTFENDRAYFLPGISEFVERYGIGYEAFIDLMEGLRDMRARLDSYDFSGKRVVFYGAGGRFKSLYPGIKKQLEGADVCVCDSNPALHGSQVLGLEVVSPEAMIKTCPDLILVSSVFYMDIVLGLWQLSEAHGTKLQIALLD